MKNPLKNSPSVNTKDPPSLKNNIISIPEEMTSQWKVHNIFFTTLVLKSQYSTQLTWKKKLMSWSSQSELKWIGRIFQPSSNPTPSLTRWKKISILQKPNPTKIFSMWEVMISFIVRIIHGPTSSDFLLENTETKNQAPFYRKALWEFWMRWTRIKSKVIFLLF